MSMDSPLAWYMFYRKYEISVNGMRLLIGFDNEFSNSSNILYLTNTHGRSPDRCGRTEVFHDDMVLGQTTHVFRHHESTAQANILSAAGSSKAG